MPQEPATPEEVRAALEKACRERRQSYAGLSKMIGRNPAYIQQFMVRGTPPRLEANDRRMIAHQLGLDEAELGGPRLPRAEEMVQVNLLSVAAAAGSGRMIDGEFAIGAYRFDRNFLRQVSTASPDELSMIGVEGDSMAPTLNDGDDALVDHSDRGRRLRDGVYVLKREDEALIVKRIALAPVKGLMTILSDNPAYPSFADCPVDSVEVMGRVVWVGRKLD